MNGLAPLTEDEKFLLNHLMRFGSDGYPINKVGARRWTWGPVRSIKGTPENFPTKKQAVEAFERYYDLLRERHAAERKAEFCICGRKRTECVAGFAKNPNTVHAEKG